MVTPKVERENNTREFGTFIIGPMERGFGLTLGNAIRRVLLSSLEGAAITDVRITDVMHEFSTIPGVREDVIQIMLQIKQIRMKLHGVDTAQIHLEVKGEGPEVARQFVDHALKERLLQVAGGAGEGPQAAGALRAAQVARRGGLHADAEGQPVDLRLFRVLGLAEAAPQPVAVARPLRGHRTGPLACIAKRGKHGRKVPRQVRSWGAVGV